MEMPYAFCKGCNACGVHNDFWRYRDSECHYEDPRHHHHQHHHHHHVVFKVEHEGTLRRFNAYSDGSRLYLNMNELRAKIIHLFNLREGSNLVLFYADSEGECVTFSSDEELRDAALYQHLNPLRIYVEVIGSGTTTSSIEPGSREASMEHQGSDLNLSLDHVLTNGVAIPPGSSSTKRMEINRSEDAPTTFNFLDCSGRDAKANNKRMLDINSIPPEKSNSSWPVPKHQFLASRYQLDEETERALLDELNEFGFFDDEGNREALRRNGYDLEKTIDYLLGAVHR